MNGTVEDPSVEKLSQTAIYWTVVDIARAMTRRSLAHIIKVPTHTSRPEK